MPNPYSAMPSRGGYVAKAFIKILLGFGAKPQSVSPKGKTEGLGAEAAVTPLL